MDQYRDELLESNVKGKNPFKDLRVRQAFLKAIDVEAIRRAVMRGQSYPTALMVARGVHGRPDDLDVRPGYDPEAARKLLAEAGYPDGFEVGMDGPNDRYVNDEAICKAVVSMLAKIGVKVNLLAQTRAKYFAKINSLHRPASTCWAGRRLTYDVLNTYQNIMTTRDDAKGSGQYNNGRWSNPAFDDLVTKSAVETDPGKRDAYRARGDQDRTSTEVGHIPLHQQALVWAMRENVDVAQLADNFFPLRYVVVTLTSGIGRRCAGARRAVIAFAARRLAQAIAVVLTVAFVAFLFSQYVGDPVTNMVGHDTPAAERAALRERLGPGRPAPVQLPALRRERAARRLRPLLPARRSRSLGLIAGRLPATLELSLAATLLAVVARRAARRLYRPAPRGVLPRLVLTASLVGVSLPTFLIGILLILIFAVQCRLAAGLPGVVLLHAVVRPRRGRAGSASGRPAC